VTLDAVVLSLRPFAPTAISQSPAKPAHLLNERLEVIEDERVDWGAWARANGFAA